MTPFRPTTSVTSTNTPFLLLLLLLLLLTQLSVVAPDKYVQRPGPPNDAFHQRVSVSRPEVVYVDRLPRGGKAISRAVADRLPKHLKVAELKSKEWGPAGWTPEVVDAGLSGGLPSGKAVFNSHGRFVYDSLGSNLNPARWDLAHPSCRRPATPGTTVSDVMRGSVNRTVSYLSFKLDKAWARDLVESIGSVAKGKTVQTHLWVGSPGAMATPHVDAEDNLYINLQGYKRFTLFPPDAIPRFSFHPLLHPSWRQAQVFEPLNQDQPLFQAGLVGDGGSTDAPAEFDAMEITLKPGEALVLPAYWIHWVTAVAPSMSINIWTESVEGKQRHTTKALLQSLGGIPLDKGLSPVMLALGAKLYAASLFDVVFEEQGGASWFLRHLLDTRYRLYSRFITGVGAGSVAVGADGGVGGEDQDEDEDQDQDKEELDHLQWRLWWEQQLVLGQHFGNSTVTYQPVWEELADTAEQDDMEDDPRFQDRVVKRIQYVVSRLAPALRRLPLGVRLLQAGDHLDTVSTIVIPRCVPQEDLHRNAHPDTVSDVVVASPMSPDPHDVAAWIQDSLVE